MGALKTQLKSDLIVAMKAHDAVAKSNIRMALTAIGTEEVAGDAARELTEAEEEAVLTREVNKRKDAAESFHSGDRPELAAKEESEAEFLSQYLPAPLSTAEVTGIVERNIALVAADLGEQPGIRQMGQVMKAVQAEVAGRSDGRTISTLVKQRLAT